MDYMRLLYRILKMASHSMNLDEIPPASEIYRPDLMKASENEIESMICKAYEEGYITGVHCVELDGMTKPKALLQDSHITPTIKGLEYMASNSTMKKLAAAAKGMKDMIPGV